MYVAMIASECSPVAKVGGLADVVSGLSREVAIRGHAVELILPKYDCMRYDHIWDLQPVYTDLQVAWYGGVISCTVWFGLVHDRKCFFIEPHSPDNFFNRGAFYGYDDDLLRYAFFSKAALEYLFKSGKRPNIIHCHDWQTGLVPVLLYEIYQHHGMNQQRVCYTIHNFKHQGVGDPSAVLSSTGLHRPDFYMQYEQMRDNISPTAINLMKGGIVYSNFVTTVSPNHRGEVMFTDQGYGLQHSLQSHQHKFGGVLNGLDYDAWNPDTDTHLPAHYNAKDIDNKYVCKDALRDRLLLRKDMRPIVAYVGRLDPQKGVSLIRHAMHYCLGNGAQFICLGSSPYKDINDHFWHLKHEMNDNPDCHIEIGFNEELAHLIYAGADMVVVPSMFEPCGLTQMIGLRYGAVPIVRGVGGLVDTVFDRDYDHHRPEEERNGYVFYEADEQGLESALARAIGLWHEYPKEFRKLIQQGMRCDYSWNKSGLDYINIYDYIRDF